MRKDEAKEAVALLTALVHRGHVITLSFETDFTMTVSGVDGHTHNDTLLGILEGYRDVLEKPWSRKAVGR